MLDKYSDNIKSFWILAGLIFLAVLLNIGVFYLVKSANADFADKNTRLMTATTKETGLSQMKKEREELMANQQTIENSFMTREKAVDFIVALEDLGRNTGNSVNIKALEGADKSKKDTMGFRVELEGSYTGLTNFLSQLETFSYFVSSTKMETSQSYDATDKKSILKTIFDVNVLTI